MAKLFFRSLAINLMSFVMAGAMLVIAALVAFFAIGLYQILVLGY